MWFSNRRAKKRQGDCKNNKDDDDDDDDGGNSGNGGNYRNNPYPKLTAYVPPVPPSNKNANASLLPYWNMSSNYHGK